jgi:hypothetical protein
MIAHKIPQGTGKDFDTTAILHKIGGAVAEKLISGALT